MSLRSLNLILAGMLILSACSKQQQRKNISLKLVNSYWVQGDPEALVAGTESNTESFLTEENFEAFSGFLLGSLIIFNEQDNADKKELTNMSEVMEQNKATDTDTTDGENIVFKFQKVEDTLRFKSDNDAIYYDFKRQGEKYKLVNVNDGSSDYATKVLHYSLKDDGTAFSILFLVQDPKDGKQLIAVTFIKPHAKVSDSIDPKYRYVAGPGVRVRWDLVKPLTLHVCGVEKRLANVYYNGAMMWEGVFKQSMLGNMKRKSQYPPFSDLNFRCIYTVDKYLMKKEQNFLNPAVTFSVIDRNRLRFLDSDIFVYNAEIEKSVTSLLSSVQKGTIKASDIPTIIDYTKKTTIAHEFGHFLGLHHQFDPNVPSIMSYSDTSMITEYDKEAITMLYEETKPLSSESASQTVSESSDHQESASSHEHLWRPSIPAQEQSALEYLKAKEELL